MTQEADPLAATMRRFAAMAEAAGADREAMAAVMDDPEAALAAFVSIAGQDAKMAVEVLASSLEAVLPMVTSGMTPARKANTLRAFAARLLADADAIHRPEG